MKLVPIGRHDNRLVVCRALRARQRNLVDAVRLKLVQLAPKSIPGRYGTTFDPGQGPEMGREPSSFHGRNNVILLILPRGQRTESRISCTVDDPRQHIGHMLFEGARQ